MKPADKPIALTCGEPAGIGPDITLQAWINRKKAKLPAFYLRADPVFISSRAQRLGLDVRICETTPEETKSVFDSALPVVATGESIDDIPGAETSATAASVITSIEQSVADVANGHAAAVVTNPINKAVLYDAGFRFPGHTEYLGKLAQDHWPEKSSHPIMMIAGPELMVVPVTIHIALADVPSALTQELILETARTTHADLKDRFGLPAPRLAFCGLNPHAGENGSMGQEEQTIITPALEQLRAEGINAIGPLPADTVFHPHARSQYDCVFGMYHDQVLIPAKTIGFDDAVNVTLGLPFVRTSPDHGTASSIAGTGKARPDSFCAALRMAAVLSSNGQN